MVLGTTGGWASPGTGTAALDIRKVMQMPGVKIKRLRWGEVPEIKSISMLCTMPQSTKIRKDPDFASDIGPYAGNVVTGPTPSFGNPLSGLYFHFGYFVPGLAVTSAAGDDIPSFKIEYKNITLCTWSDITTDAAQE